MLEEKQKQSEISLLFNQINKRERLISTFESNLDSVKNTWNEEYNKFMKEHDNFKLSFDEKTLEEFKSETQKLQSELYSKITDKYIGKCYCVYYEQTSTFCLYKFNGFQISQYDGVYLTGTTIRQTNNKDCQALSISYNEHSDVLELENEIRYKLVPINTKDEINQVLVEWDNATGKIAQILNRFICCDKKTEEEGVLTCDEVLF